MDTRQIDRCNAALRILSNLDSISRPPSAPGAQEFLIHALGLLELDIRELTAKAFCLPSESRDKSRSQRDLDARKTWLEYDPTEDYDVKQVDALFTSYPHLSIEAPSDDKTSTAAWRATIVLGYRGDLHCTGYMTVAPDAREGACHMMTQLDLCDFLLRAFKAIGPGAICRIRPDAYGSILVASSPTHNPLRNTSTEEEGDQHPRLRPLPVPVPPFVGGVTVENSVADSVVATNVGGSGITRVTGCTARHIVAINGSDLKSVSIGPTGVQATLVLDCKATNLHMDSLHDEMAAIRQQLQNAARSEFADSHLEER